jgi:hypothetical protein
MASIASGDMEIMVHTTAPSRGQDDTRYRALARAYMGFEPTTRQHLREEPISNEVEGLGAEAQSQLHDELLQSTQGERESAASFRPNDEDDASTGAQSSFHSEVLNRLGHARSLESPVLSFNSVLDNAASPVFRPLITRDEQASELVQNHQTQQSSDSWRPPASVIADSQPENDRALTAFSSPTRILELYLQKLESSEEPSTHSEPRENYDHETSAGSLPRNRESLSDSFESSRILSSPSPNKRPRMDAKAVPENRSYELLSTQDPDLNLKRKWPEMSSGEIPASSARLKTVNNSTIWSEDDLANPNKRQCAGISNSENIEGLSNILSSQAMDAMISSPPITETPAKWSNVLEIRPAPPTTSTADLAPEMFITDTLRKLEARMPSARILCPTEQSRDLRPMERGYWLVNCRSWNEGLQSRCWNSLGNYVGQNLLGWGVWCVRDENYTTIRVYCWGIITGHIYLLLHLASERKIKGTGACWIGGDGEAIIKMP